MSAAAARNADSGPFHPQPSTATAGPVAPTLSGAPSGCAAGLHPGSPGYPARLSPVFTATEEEGDDDGRVTWRCRDLAPSGAVLGKVQAWLEPLIASGALLRVKGSLLLREDATTAAAAAAAAAAAPGQPLRSGPAGGGWFDPSSVEPHTFVVGDGAGNRAGAGAGVCPDRAGGLTKAPECIRKSGSDGSDCGQGPSEQTQDGGGQAQMPKRLSFRAPSRRSFLEILEAMDAADPHSNGSSNRIGSAAEVPSIGRDSAGGAGAGAGGRPPVHPPAPGEVRLRKERHSFDVGHTAAAGADLTLAGPGDRSAAPRLRLHIDGVVPGSFRQHTCASSHLFFPLSICSVRIGSEHRFEQTTPEATAYSSTQCRAAFSAVCLSADVYACCFILPLPPVLFEPIRSLSRETHTLASCARRRPRLSVP